MITLFNLQSIDKTGISVEIFDCKTGERLYTGNLFTVPSSIVNCMIFSLTPTAYNKLEVKIWRM